MSEISRKTILLIFILQLIAACSGTVTLNNNGERTDNTDNPPGIIESEFTEVYIFASETSSFIYWKSNEPLDSYVEYGQTTEYGNRTDLQGKSWLTSKGYFSHAHHLRDLQRNTTYHYRMVLVDSEGSQARSDDMQFTTADYPFGDRIEVLSAGSCTQSSDPEDPNIYKHCLDESGKTYVLTEDITVDAGGIWIQAEDITLDLDGHMLIYNNTHDGTKRQRIGIYSTGGSDNVRILNGFIKQGDGNDRANVRDAASMGHNPVYVSGGDNVEIAALSLEWSGVQVTGIFHNYGGINSNIHHNVFNDLGSGLDTVLDRDNMVKSIKIGGSNYSIHHNLMKRSRHAGMVQPNGSPGEIFDNEIYIESWCTNGYAIWFDGGTNNSKAYGNRIYGTGYHVVGVGTTGGTYGHEIYENYIELWAHEPVDRCNPDLLPEDIRSDFVGAPQGPLSSMNGFTMRWGEVHDNDFHHNTVIVHARDGGNARGTWFLSRFSGQDVRDNSFRNNTVISYGDDDPDTDVCSIRALGQEPIEGTTPFYYENNLIVSDICNVGMGDHYGSSPVNHIFKGNTFRRIGDNPLYHTFIIGDGTVYSRYGQAFIDSTVEDGASLLDFDWRGYSPGYSDYKIQWTLTVRAEDSEGNLIPSATVVVEDKDANEVFNGNTAGNELDIVLTEYFIYGNRDPVTENYNNYTITVTADSTTQERSINISSPTTETFAF